MVYVCIIHNKNLGAGVECESMVGRKSILCAMMGFFLALEKGTHDECLNHQHREKL